MSLISVATLQSRADHIGALFSRLYNFAGSSSGSDVAPSMRFLTKAALTAQTTSGDYEQEADMNTGFNTLYVNSSVESILTYLALSALNGIQTHCQQRGSEALITTPAAPTAAPTLSLASPATNTLSAGTYQVSQSYVASGGQTIAGPAASIQTGVLPPTVAPSISSFTTGGSIAPGTYYFGYTYTNAAGETTIGPTASFTVPTGTTTNTVTFAAMALPTNAAGVKYYISQAGTLSPLYYSGSSAGVAYTATAIPATTAAQPPASNTTPVPITVAAITPLPTGATSVNWYVSSAVGASTLLAYSNNNGSGFNITGPGTGGAAPSANSVSSLPTYLTYFNGMTKFSALMTPEFGKVYKNALGVALPTAGVMSPYIGATPPTYCPLAPSAANGMGALAVGGSLTTGVAVDNTQYSEVNPVAVVSTTFSGGSAPPSWLVTGTDDLGQTSLLAPSAPTLSLAAAAANTLAVGTYQVSASYINANGQTTAGPSASQATGVAAPSVAPTVTTTSTGGSIAPGSYQFGYTYTNSAGETTISPSYALTVPAGTSTNTITFSSVAAPSGVTGYKYYVSQAGGGTLYYAGTGTPPGPFTVTAIPATSAAQPPSTNTTPQPIAVASITPLPAGVTSVNYFVSQAAGSGTLLLYANNSGSGFNITGPGTGAAVPGSNTSGTTWTATGVGNNPVSALSTTLNNGTPTVACTRQTVTLTSTTGIVPGSTLTIDTAASGVQEVIAVEAVSGLTITAVFQNVHAANAAVSGFTSYALTPSNAARRLRSVGAISPTYSSHAAGAIRIEGMQDRVAI